MIALLLGPNCLNEVNLKTNKHKVKNQEGKMGFTSLIPLPNLGLFYQYFAEVKVSK